MSFELEQLAPWYLLLLAVVLVGGAFWLQGNIGLSLADEGYLWYGTIRTAEGDIPMLDFRSYDPGRFWWGAAWSFIFGQGIMALRLSAALFQLIGLWLGLLAARRVVKRWWGLVFVGLLLLAWMYPRHKLFEHTTALVAVYMAVRLIEKPVPKYYFGAGVFTGLAALIGRNHGLYNAGAFFLLIWFLWFNQKQQNLVKRFVFWLVGIVVGYAPMLLLFIGIPGMFEFYLHEKVFVFFRRGSTNIPRPIPWPWTVDYHNLVSLRDVSDIATSWYYVIVPLFFLFVAIWLFRNRSCDLSGHSLLVASGFVGAFYTHHAIGRPGIEHLAQSIPPFLLGMVALFSLPHLREKRVWATGLTLSLLSGTFAAALTVSPLAQKLERPNNYVLYDINGDRLWILPSQAGFIDAVTHFVAENVAPDEALFIAPHRPALYPILQRKAPVHNTYLLFPETQENQEKLIADLIAHQVNWLLLGDTAVDDRDDLRFENTHPLVWEYIMAEFEPVDGPGVVGNHQFFRRRSLTIDHNQD